MTGTPSPASISTKLQRIAELARRAPSMVLTTLAHHIDIDFLREAYRRTRKDGATGVDGQTAEAYAAALGINLQRLLDRLKAGTYRAPPVRRVHIPKGNGTTRPIGIPTFEDKVLQRAVAMVLEAVYEQDFLVCSYGFRPDRSAHQALEALRNGLMEMNGGWVVELDIQRFFDTLDHGQLRDLLDQRVRDGVVRRAIDKWLKAGVLENGNVTSPEEGTPQGGVVSPLLANIYLHEVLDLWFEREVKPRMRGKAFLIRYADDAVLVFADEADARRVLEVLPKRFGKYNLTLHPEKTRLVAFKRPALVAPKSGAVSFDLLGFTHYWTRSRKGYWVIKRKTARSRLQRALKRVADWCKEHRHMPVRDQARLLRQKMSGHYGYFGITGNSRAVTRFFHGVRVAWRKWLDRRSQHRHMPWARFERLMKRYPLPAPVCVHSLYRAVANP
jgi:RNA-directed DNA polymerase